MLPKLRGNLLSYHRCLMHAAGRRSQSPMLSLGRGSRRTERHEVTDKLPPLRLWKLRPNRHAATNDSVGKNPEKSPGSRLPNRIGAQTGPFPATFGHLSMTLGAVLLESIGSRSHRVRIARHWIAPLACLLRRLRQFGVNGAVEGNGRRGFFLPETRRGKA